jgi:hypothetical protein
MYKTITYKYMLTWKNGYVCSFFFSGCLLFETGFHYITQVSLSPKVDQAGLEFMIFLPQSLPVQILVLPKKKKKYVHSGGKDQEDRGSKPARGNTLRNPILGEKKNKPQNRAGRLAHVVEHLHSKHKEPEV